MNLKFIDEIFYKSENFLVCNPKPPHIPREDGGHIWIRAKAENIGSRLDLSPEKAIEVMRLTMLISEATVKGLKNRNINIEKINYQENGNWAFLKGGEPAFHIHLYGRTRNSKSQVFGEALRFPNEDTGFYDNFEPLSPDDIKEIQKQIEMLENAEKYNLKKWKLV